jgi:hypothetical protein
MATRMQQRRGTAAQWISTNGGAGPVLNAGEMGWESDTNKFKIGDGVNNWTSLDYFSDINSTVDPAFGSSITFEGTTANAFETTLTVTDPTADRTITFPDATGTVALTSDIAELSQDAVDAALTAGTGITKTYNDGANTLTIAVDTTTIQARVADVSDTEIGYLNGVTSAIQTQLDDKSTASKTETLTNKSISLASNTVTSTLAQLNTAISDADVATLAGTETLTNKTLTTPVISSITNGAATLTLPSSTGTIALTTDIPSGVVTETGTQTLTNKTLTSPVVSGLTLSDSGIVIEGSSADAHETTLTVTNPTADRTITFPDETGTVQLRVTDVSDTEIGYLNGVTSAIQTQMDAKAPLAAPALTGDATAVNLTISGNLTVNGTTTNINSTNLVVEDKNIVLADVETPTDITADGGGITLKGTTDKTFNWVDATDSWTSSEHINLASGKSYSMNGTALKDVSETLTNKTLTSPVISSISNTGTLTLPTSTDTLVGRATTDTLTNKTLGSAVATTAFTLNATAELRLADTDSSHYVGFKSPGTVTTNKIWTLPAADGTAGYALTTDGSGTLSWAAAGGGGGAAFSEFMLIGV